MRARSAYRRIVVAVHAGNRGGVISRMLATARPSCFYSPLPLTHSLLFALVAVAVFLYPFLKIMQKLPMWAQIELGQ